MSWRGVLRCFSWLVLLACLHGNLVAEPVFPTLSGHVVDTAQMLTSTTAQVLERALTDHETDTTDQVVVVTIEDLGGSDIETYGYELGRHWGIGQKDKNNGVLLIVAKAERKVRIEVGYGLEGTLTDAISANIINTVIVPRFKRAQFDSGIDFGARSIMQALLGEYSQPKINTSS